jgi:hypothetical protein
MPRKFPESADGFGHAALALLKDAGYTGRASGQPASARFCTTAMKRPVTLLAIFAIAFFALAGGVHAQAGQQQPPAPAPKPPPPPPEPEPEPQLEPEAPAAAPGQLPAEPEAAQEPEEEIAAPAAAPTVLVPRTVCEGHPVKAVEVTGNGRVSADDVRASMKLKPGTTCTDSAVARDVRALWDLGYFDDLIFRARLEDNDVVLSIEIKERPAIGKITFEGDDEIDEEDIDEKVTLEVGTILVENEVRDQLPKIRDVYAEEG